MAEAGHAILLEEDIRIDARSVGDKVAAAFGLTRLEAKMMIRKGRGILLESVPEPHVAGILEELTAQNIRAFAVSHAELPRWPASRKVGLIQRDEEFFFHQAIRETGLEAMAWEEVFVVSCGVIARPPYKDFYDHIRFDSLPALHKMEGTTRDVLRENIILKIAHTPSESSSKDRHAKPKVENIYETLETKHPDQLMVIVDILSRTLEIHLRIPMADLGYVYETGGVRLGGAWGFSLLMKDLTDRCAGACTEMTKSLASCTDFKNLVFVDLEEFNRYTRWWTIKGYLRLKKKISQDEPSSPLPP